MHSATQRLVGGNIPLLNLRFATWKQPFPNCRLLSTHLSMDVPTNMRNHHFRNLLKNIENSPKYFFHLKALNDPRFFELPFSIRILLESAIRNCNGMSIKERDVETILDWKRTSLKQKEIPFMPARVLLQDFTGVPSCVDLAAMRDSMAKFGGNPSLINPLVPVDLVIDHSVQVDFSRSVDAIAKNQDIEMQRNSERFAFLKWGSKAFSNMLIVPPGSGIVHQVNLEFLARCVFDVNNILYPDSVVGTDSHTTMIDALGVVGWGVGGIEAEAVMLGQPMSMVLPQVIGFELTGKLPDQSTATDLVLTVTQMIRKHGAVGKFVEFFGSGVQTLSLADRATIANMSPEYGATMGFFAYDEETLKYLQKTGRDEKKIQLMKQYLLNNDLFVHPDGHSSCQIVYTETMHLNLSDVEPCVSGPKRPHDRVSLKNAKSDFKQSLTAPIGFKGYNLSNDRAQSTFLYNGEDYQLQHGSVVIASITSCTNTSNPSVLLGAGLLAKRAVEKGLSVLPYIKTSLSPGSKAVTEYLQQSGLMKYLEQLGFYHAGYGCMTCIGNSGELDKSVADAITSKDLVAAAVLSGNRNFEGRVHPLTRANYLASPLLVVLYALAGRVDIDFYNEPVGVGKDGANVYLSDLWPSSSEIAELEEKYIKGSMFSKIYKNIQEGTPAWNALPEVDSLQFPWNESSTYIHDPPFFKGMTRRLPNIASIKDGRCLLFLGDSITTDHISPAGNIAKDSPAAAYLTDKGVSRKDFNTYGSRRGNDEVMVRGTFANIRLINKICPKAGPKTVHYPTGELLSIFDASERYRRDNTPLIVLAGEEYGSGSSRDWAAKGPYLLGVKAIIAQSFERIHRTNLVGMGILPLQFVNDESAESVGLTGKETFSIDLNNGDLSPGQMIDVQLDNGKQLTVRCRIDTEAEVEYFKNGGILPYVLRGLLPKESAASKNP